ncbi:hypothetical protein HanIR_Chr15g0777261 [Helianthus annuus]|nr:hypothetical protein HanIR_Chr15g0777261 [Helianthus annuus]
MFSICVQLMNKLPWSNDNLHISKSTISNQNFNMRIICFNQNIGFNYYLIYGIKMSTINFRMVYQLSQLSIFIE